jgi:uncharacterized protein YndB with AHSA1/START domain
MPTATVTIRQTPEKLFSFLTDVEKLPQWTPLKNVKLLTGGPLSVGSRFTQTVEIIGKTIESEMEVTDINAPTSLSLKSISGPVNLVQRFTLTPTADGTNLKLDMEGEPTGLLKVAQPLLKPAVEKQLNEQVNKLKQIAEQW